MAHYTVEESLAIRKLFRSDCEKALEPLEKVGLDNEIPVLSVFCSMIDRYNNSGIPWFGLEGLILDADEVLNGFHFWRGRSVDGKTRLLQKHLGGNHRFRDVSTWLWAKEKASFSKDKLIRDTNSVIRDAVRVIGSDNNRLTDKTLICLIAGKLHVGGDNSNIWKEATKLFTKHSFVKFLKDLLDHSSLVHNASYTDSKELERLLDDEISHHHTIRGKIKWGSDTLTW